MNVLVLHNNNLPSYLLAEDTEHPFPQDIIITSESVALPETDIPDFDSYISNILIDNSRKAKLLDNKYDIIILPFNTTENALEYTGLRILAHLRLTKEWRCMSTPILFLGPDTLHEVNQYSELGSLLNSFNVFKSSRNKQEDILGMLQLIKKETKAIDKIEETPHYKDFLKRMKSLSAPANYASHHSLANEWAIMRWNDMMTNPIQLDNKDFTSMLYYKYLRAVYGNVKLMKKWKKENPFIVEKIDVIGPEEENEPKKKLVLIDDEWEKGWSQLLEHIADSSGFSFEYCPIKKEWDREVLKKEIESFIDKIEDKEDKDNGADCYLLDLRLHDTDFDEEYIKQNKLRLSGFDVLDYIKRKNVAIPVVVFSASNKLWNFKDAVWNYKDPITKMQKEGAIDFVLKEAPESVLKPSESYKLYTDFVSSIRTSFKLSELKKIVDKQSDLKKICPDVDSMDVFVNLVLQDRGIENNTMLKACLLNLWTYLEEYIKDNYYLFPNPNAPQIVKSINKQTIVPNQKSGFYDLYSKNKNNKIPIDIKCVFLQKIKNAKSKHKRIFNTICFKEEIDLSLDYENVNYEQPFEILIYLLYNKYNIDQSIVNNLLLPLGIERNKMSHETGDINCSFSKLYDFYFKIIVPIIEQDYNKP